VEIIESLAGMGQGEYDGLLLSTEEYVDRKINLAGIAEQQKNVRCRLFWMTGRGCLDDY